MLCNINEKIYAAFMKSTYGAGGLRSGSWMLFFCLFLRFIVFDDDEKKENNNFLFCFMIRAGNYAKINDL